MVYHPAALEGIEIWPPCGRTPTLADQARYLRNNARLLRDEAVRLDDKAARLDAQEPQRPEPPDISTVFPQD